MENQDPQARPEPPTPVEGAPAAAASHGHGASAERPAPADERPPATEPATEGAMEPGTEPPAEPGTESAIEPGVTGVTGATGDGADGMQPVRLDKTGEQTGPAMLRASDADRDKVADLLREALAEGRLTPQEHAERIDAVYTARTYAELAPIVSDLPGAGALGLGPAAEAVQPRPGAGLAPPSREPASITAVFAGAERKGRWLVEPHTNILNVFGGVDLDFRQAVLSQREVTVNVVAIFGGVEIKVPPGVRVIGSGAAVFGAWSLPTDEVLDPDAPVIRLTGMVLFGGVEVKRKAAKPSRGTPRPLDDRREALRELRDARREARRDRRNGRSR